MGVQRLFPPLHSLTRCLTGKKEMSVKFNVIHVKTENYEAVADFTSKHIPTLELESSTFKHNWRKTEKTKSQLTENLF